ncbi:MAG: hypothetical protein CMP11_07865 [Zetaproteobacteria bacterium]|nr:hypothetical protein [Pseudobdellovibrionaceae bacterium]|tara:strand:+ start:356 stop:1018 length:663 start_codon:yes stop_codon:yes gene_type:complete
MKILAFLVFSIFSFLINALETKKNDQYDTVKKEQKTNLSEKIHVVGVISAGTSDKSLAILRDLEKNKTQMGKIGDEVLTGSGFHIKQIERRKVLVSNGEEEYYLRYGGTAISTSYQDRPVEETEGEDYFTEDMLGYEYLDTQDEEDFYIKTEAEISNNQLPNQKLLEELREIIDDFNDLKLEFDREEQETFMREIQNKVAQKSLNGLDQEIEIEENIDQD